jgi:hypothetical protein
MRSLIPFFSYFFFFVSFRACRRGAHHASALIALIERFPLQNPRPDAAGVDMSAQLRLIRSRYKAMCASLGIRARLQPAASPPVGGIGTRTQDPEEHGPVGTTNDHQGVSLLVQGPDAERAPGAGRQKRTVVWALDGPSAASSASTQGFSF